MDAIFFVSSLKLRFGKDKKKKKMIKALNVFKAAPKEYIMLSNPCPLYVHQFERSLGVSETHLYLPNNNCHGLK